MKVEGNMFCGDEKEVELGCRSLELRDGQAARPETRLGLLASLLYSFHIS